MLPQSSGGSAVGGGAEGEENREQQRAGFAEKSARDEKHDYRGGGDQRGGDFHFDDGVSGAESAAEEGVGAWFGDVDVRDQRMGQLHDADGRENQRRGEDRSRDGIAVVEMAGAH